MTKKSARRCLAYTLRLGAGLLLFITATPVIQAALPESPKKGVGTWTMPNASRALESLRLAWYYTWESGSDRVSPPGKVEFVPMIWGAQHANSQEIERAKATGSTNLLGFNEPDHRHQSRLTVEQALDLWPLLERSGLRLGSPATTGDPSKPGSWLERFIAGAETRKYRVDFICVHWYGSGTDPDTEVTRLKNFLEAAHARFKRPVWLTEFALVNWMDGKQSADAATQAAFVARALPLLDALPFLERYAWFALPPWHYGSDPVPTHLFNPDQTFTAVGQAYRNYPKQP